MNINKLTQNIITAVLDPAILAHWIIWNASKLVGIDPCLTIHGRNFAYFPNFNAYLGAWRYRSSIEEMIYLESALADAHCIIDVGANLGVLSTTFAAFAPDAQMYCFEPHPATARACRKNLAMNGLSARADVIASAVGKFTGYVNFSDGPSAAVNRIVGDVTEKRLEVPIVTLEEFAKKRGIEVVDFLKIDVEGAEMDVLEGAETLFAGGRVRAGLIEVCPKNLRDFGRDIGELLEFFDRHDLRFFLIGQEQHQLDLAQLHALSDDFLGNAGFEAKC